MDHAYYDSLSRALQKSLAFQGDEVKEFERDPLRNEMVSLRLWDDGAKLVGIEAVTPRARSYLDMTTDYLASQAGDIA